MHITDSGDVFTGGLIVFFGIADDPSGSPFGGAYVDGRLIQVRMIRLFLDGARAFLEQRWHPVHGLGAWSIVCPADDISQNEVAEVWSHHAFFGIAGPGRPEGPRKGGEAERWQARVTEIGEPAARDEYYAATPRANGRYPWWDDNILRWVRRQKNRK